MIGRAGAAPAAGPRASAAGAGRAEDGQTPDFHRLSIYMACLGLSFAVLLAAGGRHGAAVAGAAVFWVAAGFAVFGMIVGALAPMMDAGKGGRADASAGPGLRGAGAWHSGLLNLALGRLVRGAVATAAVLALIGAADGAPAWPSVLVLLFAGRVLMEIADLRLSLAWRAPLAPHPAAAAQSVGAALAFGGFLALVFGQAAALAAHMPGLRALLPAAGDGGPTVAGIAVEALSGDTPVHRALIYLFFVVVAFIADAWRLHWRDRAALGALGHGLTADALPAALGRLAAVYPGSRALLACRTIADEMDAAGQAAFRAATDFHLASRRFVRAIVPMLPLLGFVGTVIGLSMTLSELPRDTGDGARAAADISASLGGLAIKFQTTLLGLVGGMIASTALNALEKAETELMAECALKVAAVTGEAARPVPPPAG